MDCNATWKELGQLYSGVEGSGSDYIRVMNNGVDTTQINSELRKKEYIIKATYNLRKYSES